MMTDSSSKVLAAIIFIVAFIFIVAMICSCNREQAAEDFVKKIEAYPEVSRAVAKDGRVIIWVKERSVSTRFDRARFDFSLAWGIEVELKYPPASP